MFLPFPSPDGGIFLFKLKNRQGLDWIGGFKFYTRGGCLKFPALRRELSTGGLLPPPTLPSSSESFQGIFLQKTKMESEKGQALILKKKNE